MFSKTENCVSWYRPLMGDQSSRAWSKGCIIREAVEWDTLSMDTILLNDSGGFLSQKHFEICFKFLGPSSFMSPVLGVSTCFKPPWEKLWTTEKAITLIGTFLNYDLASCRTFRRRLSWPFWCLSIHYLENIYYIVLSKAWLALRHQVPLALFPPCTLETSPTKNSLSQDYK